MLAPVGAEDADDVKVGFSKINTDYHFTTNNFEKEIENLIAYTEGHCPVMNTLTHAPEFSHGIHLNEN